MFKAKGMMAIFDDSDALIEAVKKVRRLRIKRMDAYTPFAVHGLDAAMGLKRSWIPWVTFVIALGGASLAFYFQAWAMSIDWPVNVGGKPGVGWPAFVPVSFEFMVLSSGVTTALIILGMCWPFDFWTKWDKRLTDDRFALFVDASDPKFQASELQTIFQECHAEEIQHLH